MVLLWGTCEGAHCVSVRICFWTPVLILAQSLVFCFMNSISLISCSLILLRLFLSWNLIIIEITLTLLLKCFLMCLLFMMVSHCLHTLQYISWIKWMICLGNYLIYVLPSCSSTVVSIASSSLEYSPLCLSTSLFLLF